MILDESIRRKRFERLYLETPEVVRFRRVSGIVSRLRGYVLDIEEEIAAWREQNGLSDEPVRVGWRLTAVIVEEKKNMTAEE